MLTFIEQAHTGVKGFVTEADGITPPAAGLKGRHVEVRVRRASGPAGRYAAFEFRPGYGQICAKLKKREGKETLKMPDFGSV